MDFAFVLVDVSVVPRTKVRDPSCGFSTVSSRLSLPRPVSRDTAMGSRRLWLNSHFRAPGFDYANERTHLLHRLVEHGVEILDDVGHAPEDLEAHGPEKLCPCRQ